MMQQLFWGFNFQFFFSVFMFLHDIVLLILATLNICFRLLGIMIVGGMIVIVHSPDYSFFGPQLPKVFFCGVIGKDVIQGCKGEFPKFPFAQIKSMSC